MTKVYSETKGTTVRWAEKTKWLVESTGPQIDRSTTYAVLKQCIDVVWQA